MYTMCKLKLKMYDLQFNYYAKLADKSFQCANKCVRNDIKWRKHMNCGLHYMDKCMEISKKQEKEVKAL